MEERTFKIKSFFNTSKSGILMVIKVHIHNDNPKPLKQKAKNKNKDKWCAFHKDICMTHNIIEIWIEHSMM